jgi:LemA protein
VVVLLILLVLAVVMIGWVVSVYNSLVGARNLVKNAFAHIEVQLKRRHDLIPNLVETAKGYMKHESGTLEAVVAARNQALQAQKALAAGGAVDPEAMKKVLSAESQLAASLGRLNVAVEAYPELKANENMRSLMEELSSSENKISFARQAYNDSVMDYNNRREMFPGSLIAGTFNFQAATAFEVENVADRELPKVGF